MDEVEAARTSHMKQDMDATYFGGISEIPIADGSSKSIILVFGQ